MKNLLYFKKNDSDTSLGICEIIESEKIFHLLNISEKQKNSVCSFNGEFGKNIITDQNIVCKNFEVKRVDCKKVVLELIESKITNSIITKLEENKLSEQILIPVNNISLLSSYDKYECSAYFIFEGKRYPAILFNSKEIVFLFDVGESFFGLLTESYYKRRKDTILISNKFIEIIYKRIPYFIRKRIYLRYYKKLHSQIKKVDGYYTSFPIDPAGFFLREVVISSINYFCDTVKISHFPSKYKSACVITHDIEPTKYSYTRGLSILISNLEKERISSTINLVGIYCKKYLKSNNIAQNQEIASHGLYHDRNFATVSSEERLNRLIASKKIIESVTNRKIIGFRSPALQIPSDLVDLLIKAGYCYDMSMIDIQRETVDIGCGNSYFLPYYLYDDKKKSSLLEIPTTAPDCISPIYFGYSFEETKELFSKKINFLNSIGGCGNFIVHAGVWGDKDGILRIDLLNHILSEVKKQKMWISKASDIYFWWVARNNIRYSLKGKLLFIENCNDCEISDFECIINNNGKEKIVYINKLKPKEKKIIL